MEHWHIGILTPSIEKSLDLLCGMPDTQREGWTTNEIEFLASDMIVGDGGRLRIAMGRIGGIVYELIQPIDDCSYHAKAMNLRGPGIHHSAYFCDDNHQNDIVKNLKAGGGRVVWEAKHKEEHVYYIELHDGTIWEIINCCPFMPD